MVRILRVAIGLELDLCNPRRRIVDTENLVGLGRDGGQIRIEDLRARGIIMTGRRSDASGRPTLHEEFRTMLRLGIAGFRRGVGLLWIAADGTFR